MKQRIVRCRQERPDKGLFPGKDHEYNDYCKTLFRANERWNTC